LYSDLAIDGFFIEVIKELPSSACNDIEINPDGSWKQIDIKQENESLHQNPQSSIRPNGNSSGGTVSAEVETISIDDDSDNDENSKTTSAVSSKSILVKQLSEPPKATASNEPVKVKVPPATIEMISLSDSEDEEPTSSKQPPKAPQSDPPKAPSAVASSSSTSSSNPPPPPKPAAETAAMNDDDEVICLSD
jgi:hypothetical protein